MNEHLTGEQIRAVVDEINALHQEHQPEQWEAGWWRIDEIEHLYLLPGEVYAVTYQRPRQTTIYQRASWGALISVAGWSYYASDNFEDRHPGEPESDEADQEAEQAEQKREYEIALREGGYYECFPESEAGHE